MRHYQVGQAYVPLVVLVNDDGPASGLTINARIFRPVDGFQWDWDDDTFKTPGSVVTPDQLLVESVDQPGLYLGSWNTALILAVMDTVIVYESTGLADFVQDDPVSFQDAADLSSSVGGSFIQPVIDKTQRTLTVVFGLKSIGGNLIATTSAEVTVKDDLGNPILATLTASVTGIHRAIFPNADLIPNRVLLFEIEYTIGLDTFSSVDAVKVIGATPA